MGKQKKPLTVVEIMSAEIITVAEWFYWLASHERTCQGEKINMLRNHTSANRVLKIWRCKDSNWLPIHLWIIFFIMPLGTWDTSSLRYVIAWCASLWLYMHTLSDYNCAVVLFLWNLCKVIRHCAVLWFSWHICRLFRPSFQLIEPMLNIDPNRYIGGLAAR